MAIRERKGQKPWQVYWNNPLTGKRECESFATRLEAEKADSLIKHRLKFEKESFGEAKTQEVKTYSLEAVYMSYLRQRQFTKKSLGWQLDSMKLALSLYGQKPVSEIGEADIKAVIAGETAKGVKPVTVRNRLRVLYTVLRYAYDNGWCGLPRLPKLPPAGYQRFVPPTPQELADMLALAPGHLQRVIIIGSQCGVRIGQSELFKLRWEDVDLQRLVLRVHGSRKNTDAPWREVPIRKELAPAFMQWQQADIEARVEWLIHWQGKPVKSIKKAWDRLLAAAGITRHIRPYDLRHAFATELIAAGVDIGTTAKLMGHSGPGMLLKHYQYVMDRQKREAVESLPHVPSLCAQNEKAVADLQ
ncbi:MAG: site-specific integrase [Desulfovibrio sp.]|nr:site-specific integrase [Desulfovibrio sp.]